MTTKPIVVLLIFGSLAALSPAPVYHRHDKGKGAPEASQAELAQQQALASSKGVLPAVGSIPQNSSREYHHSAKSDDQAAEMLRSTKQEIQDPSSKAKTVAVLEAAQRDVQNTKPSRFRSLFGFVFAGCFGYGAFFFFRRWADKNLPAPSKLKLR
jgi:hypothetical protein